MNKSIWITCITGLACVPVTTTAEQVWGSFSLSYLYGEHYEVGDSTRKVLTIEHASAHTWGDNFFFLDHVTADNGDVSNYFELSPRASITSLANLPTMTGIIKDIFIAGTWEGGTFNNYLTGFGVGLNTPGFKYLNLNLYWANNDLWDDDQQLTINWGAPFTISGAAFLYDGFIDYSTASDSNTKELNYTSQLKWNIASYWHSQTPFYVGVEYAYWNNKYGIKGANERNPNLLFKWHF